MLSLTVFNVGQASSMLLDFGHGRLGVIDCGVGISGENPLAVELGRRIDEAPQTQILFVLFTHLDWDHINGFAELMENTSIRGKIRRVYCEGPEFRSLWEAVTVFVRRKSGAGFRDNIVTSKSLKSIGYINKIVTSPPPAVSLNFHHVLVSPQPSDPEEYPVRLKLRELGDDFLIWLFSPSQTLRDKAANGIKKMLQEGRLPTGLLKSIGESRPDWNAASTVLMIEHKGVRILFGGDANSVTWSDILARGGEEMLGSDVAIAWHHGARLGFRGGEDFDYKVWSSVLRAERGGPPCVAISHGRGHYGHPHEETISSIGILGGSVLCTELREHATFTADDYQEALNYLGIGLYLNLVEGWELNSINGNACSGNIAANVNEEGKLSVTCEGPRQFGGPSRKTCCLYSSTGDR